MCLSCAYRVEAMDTVDESAILKHCQIVGMYLRRASKRHMWG